MKTFVMAAVAATVTAGATLAHPVNEPHICGIDPSTVMDWPASNWVSENTGQIYDKGAYFFIATNDNDGSGEYTTTHTRIWKDSMEHNGACRVTGVDIFHKNEDPEVAAPVVVETPVVTPDGRVVTNTTKYWHKGFKGNDKVMVIRDVTVTKDGVSMDITRRVITDQHGRKTVIVDAHGTETAVQRKFKKNGVLKSEKTIDYKQDRKVSKKWSTTKGK